MIPVILALAIGVAFYIALERAHRPKRQRIRRFRFMTNKPEANHYYTVLPVDGGMDCGVAYATTLWEVLSVNETHVLMRDVSTATKAAAYQVLTFSGWVRQETPECAAREPVLVQLDKFRWSQADEMAKVAASEFIDSPVAKLFSGVTV